MKSWTLETRVGMTVTRDLNRALRSRGRREAAIEALLKKLSFALLAVLLVLGTVEAMAWLTHVFLYDEDGLQFGADNELFQSYQTKLYEGWHLHPFYGNVRSTHDLNLASHEKECALVVGLLGGSVASHVSSKFRLALLRHVESLGNDVWPIWIDMAHDSYRQPQQAQAFADKLAGGTRFDVVVSVDGFNEAVDPRSFVPREWPYLVGMTAEQRIVVGRILALRDEQETLLARGGWIYGSETFGLLRRWRLDRIAHLVVRHHHDLSEAGNALYGLEKHGPTSNIHSDELRRAVAERWYRGAWLLASLAKHHGAEYYHFLQPNQYIPGTKPLTEEELAEAFRPDSQWLRPARSTYPLLVEYGHRLREQGVQFFDLSRIYAHNRETLYSDICCHLNDRGYELMAAAMLRRIIEAVDAYGAISVNSENESCLLRRWRSVVARVEAGEFGEPLARSVFDIYREDSKERTLVYLKRHCTVGDIEERFFLHWTRRGGSIGNKWFEFVRHGVLLDGETCVAIVPWEAIGSVVHMRAGQIGDGAGKWSVDLDRRAWHLEATTDEDQSRGRRYPRRPSS